MADKVKVTVNLSDEDVGTIRRIANRHRLTMTETIRRAIATEKFVEDVAEQGGSIVVEDKDKSLHRVLMR